MKSTLPVTLYTQTTLEVGSDENETSRRERKGKTKKKKRRTKKKKREDPRPKKIGDTGYTSDKM